MIPRSPLFAFFTLAACGGAPTINLGSDTVDAGAVADLGFVDTGIADAARPDTSSIPDGGQSDAVFADASVFGDVGFATDVGEQSDGSLFGTDLDVIWVSTPNPIQPGGFANLMVEARNVGAWGTASVVSIRLCAGSCTSSPSVVELGRVATGRIGPADTTILMFPVTFPGAFTRGVFTLQAMIDPEQSEPEVSETNNVDDTMITIGTPALGFMPSIANFGGVAPGNTGTLSVTLSNPANGAISGTWALASEGDPAFTVSTSGATPFTIPPGGTLMIDVGFTPARLGPHRGAVLVTVAPDTAPSIAIPLWAYAL